jgi:hypothetical protein
MIEYLTYKEVKYPIRISYYALKMFKKETNKELENIMSDNNIELLEPLLFYSLEAGAQAIDQKFIIKRELVQWMLDENWQEFVKIIAKFFPPIEVDSKKKNK